MLDPVTLDTFHILFLILGYSLINIQSGRTPSFHTSSVYASVSDIVKPCASITFLTLGPISRSYTVLPPSRFVNFVFSLGHLCTQSFAIGSLIVINLAPFLI